MFISLESVKDFVINYGYLAVFLGSLVEGESIIITAAICAAHGLLSISKVTFIAFFGTIVADQLLFYAGIKYGKWLLSKDHFLLKYSSIIKTFLQKYPNTLLLTFRFVPGIRILTPIVVGIHNFSQARFTVLNLVSAVIWAVASCGAGYFFGAQILDLSYTFGILLVALYLLGMYFVHKKIHARLDHEARPDQHK